MHVHREIVDSGALLVGGRYRTMSLVRAGTRAAPGSKGFFGRFTSVAWWSERYLRNRFKNQVGYGFVPVG
jgi:hypothetical protein